MFSVSDHGDWFTTLLLFAALILFVRPTVAAAFPVRFGWPTLCVILMGWMQFPMEVSRTIAVVVGACLVWSVMRWVNRRNDPRYGMRPSDAP